MGRDRQAVKAELFRLLHRGPPLLLLPNAWDAMSARLSVTGRFDAVNPKISHPEAQHLFSAR